MPNTEINQNQVVGKVLKLFISQKDSSTRIVRDKLYLDNGGVIDDKFHNKDINRSVLISSTKSYDMALENNISMESGDLGENILIDCNPYNLPIGTQVKIGEVTLEITQNCTLCKSLTKVDNKLPKILKDDRGVFSKVLKSGFIYLHDSITLQ